MPRLTPQQRVDLANKTLQEIYGIYTKIDLEGLSLRIRKTLIPRPGSKSKKEKPHQQTLVLGLKATPAGIQQAIKDVCELEQMLAQRRFTWKAWFQYLRRTGALRSLFQETVGEVIKKYEKHFLSIPPKPGQRRTQQQVWDTEAFHYLNQLPKTEVLSDEIVLEAITDVDATRAKRQKLCLWTRRLLEFAELDTELNFSELSGEYEIPPLKEGELPTEKEILEVYYTIPDPEWQNAYGLQATFGLRNHEVLLVDPSTIQGDNGAYYIEVPENTKTGYRLAYALYPEYVEKFNLRAAKLPQVNTEGKTLQEIGQEVTKAYRRLKMPFNPYILRHAWAIRAISFGLITGVAAKFMGHNETVHKVHYWRYLDKARTMLIFQSILDNPNRPKPPEL